MKGKQKFIKTNIKLFLGFTVGAFISGFVVYAANIGIDASLVTYNNSNTTLISTNIKDALDELYTKSNSSYYLLKKYESLSGKPKYYGYKEKNTPTIESPTTTPTCTTVYGGLYEDGQYGLCIKKDGKQHCFRYKNWLVEKEHIKEIFGDSSCKYNYEYNQYIVRCTTSRWNCYVASSGKLFCVDYNTMSFGEVNDDETTDYWNNC